MKKILTFIIVSLLLFFIVFALGVFIYIFQSYFNTLYGLAFLIAAMALYALFTNIAYKIKTYQMKKYPQIVNENFKPFVTIMIPSHNEESVISKTIENVLNLDYNDFERKLFEYKYKLNNNINGKIKEYWLIKNSKTKLETIVTAKTMYSLILESYSYFYGNQTVNEAVNTKTQSERIINANRHKKR